MEFYSQFNLSNLLTNLNNALLLLNYPFFMILSYIQYFYKVIYNNEEVEHIAENLMMLLLFYHDSYFQ